MPIDQEEMNRLNRMTERSWHPRPIDALGVLFRAEFRGEEILPGYDFAVGWSDLFAGGLEIVQTAGDHFSMVNGHITTLVRSCSPTHCPSTAERYRARR
jgi:thioesterase domain-containing protein